ncbi:flagellar hook-length control protein FliK [Fontimonas thermophila]|nr:flagellar hook-length control protein FliK [Fontimonas thermophila]
MLTPAAGADGGAPVHPCTGSASPMPDGAFTVVLATCAGAAGASPFAWAASAADAQTAGKAPEQDQAAVEVSLPGVMPALVQAWPLPFDARPDTAGAEAAVPVTDPTDRDSTRALTAQVARHSLPARSPSAAGRADAQALVRIAAADVLAHATDAMVVAVQPAEAQHGIEPSPALVSGPGNPPVSGPWAAPVLELRAPAPLQAMVPAGAQILQPYAPGFAADLAEHIVWQIDDGIGEAKIELHPAELGALTVRVEIHGDRASVHIIAAEAATRVLLGQALPQLRELLGHSGLQLARSHIEPVARRDADERPTVDTTAEVTAPRPARRRITPVVFVDAYV